MNCELTRYKFCGTICVDSFDKANRKATKALTTSDLATEISDDSSGESPKRKRFVYIPV